MTGVWGTELRDTRGTSKLAHDTRGNYRDLHAHPTYHVVRVDGTQGWKVETERRSGEPCTEGQAHSARLGDLVSGPHLRRIDPHSTNHCPSSQLFGPTHTQTTQNAPTPTSNNYPTHFMQGRTGDCTSHSRSRPGAEPHAHTNEARRTSPTAEQTTMA